MRNLSIQNKITITDKITLQDCGTGNRKREIDALVFIFEGLALTFILFLLRLQSSCKSCVKSHYT